MLDGINFFCGQTPRHPRHGYRQHTRRLDPDSFWRRFIFLYFCYWYFDWWDIGDLGDGEGE